MTTRLVPFLPDQMREFIEAIANRVVVVGSVARGVRWPKDLDLYWDMDSEPAYKQINDAIKRLGLMFYSPFIKAWTFNYGWQVEIIPVNVGPDYRVVRRRASKQDILGMDLWVARPEDAKPMEEK